MAVEVKLQQRLQQSLALTPQLQQSLKMLQMGHLEYSETLAEELLANPALEEGGDSFDEDPQFTADDDNTPVLRALESGLPEDPGFSSFERTRTADPESPGFAELGAQMPEGLTSHLLMQLRTMDVSERELQIAGHIIGNLNRDGYFECGIDEITASTAASESEVEQVLAVVQTLDPPGIAARDLRECLLIQLDMLGQRNQLSWHLVEKHLSLLETQKHEQIAKIEGVPLARLVEALTIVRNLEPRPGRPFLDEPPVFVSPDVYVRKVGDEFVVTLNDSGLPRLQLNNTYRELLLERGHPERSYLQERFRSASWLLRNIQLRQQTILKVARNIVSHQLEFFENGISGLRPLVLREVADAVGLHESTVSRVTSNKYMHTPHGIFVMKFFFRSGISSGNGEISSEAVKLKIRDLLDAENPEHPLSDQEIVEELKSCDIKIARRTVAKYREAMNVLSSSQRKRMY